MAPSLKPSARGAKAAAAQPWERQPGEGDAAFAAFVVYRDSGPDRNQRDTCAKIGRALSTVAEHCRRWGWPARAAAYDSWLDQQGTAAVVDELVEMNRRHAKLAMDALEKLAARLRNLQPEEVTPKVLASLLKAASDLERQARGAAPTGAEDDPLHHRLVVEHVNDWRKQGRP